MRDTLTFKITFMTTLPYFLKDHMNRIRNTSLICKGFERYSFVFARIFNVLTKP